MKYDIVTIGDAMKDIFVFPAIDEMEKPIFKDNEKFLTFGFGDKITISDIHYDIGGTACNVAAATSKLGLKSALITTLGKDNEGEEILDRLKKAGVSTEFIKISKEKKTSFSVIISFKGERSILVFHSFTPSDFEVPKKIDSDWIYIGPLGEGYRSLYSKITSMAAEHNIKIALNPGAVQINDGLNAFGGLLKVTNTLFINKEEGAKLCGISGIATAKEIIRYLQKTGPEIIVLTDGKDGAYASSGDDFYKVGAYPGSRVEATGAGDSFASAFLAAQIKGEDIYNSLKWGVINSASVVGEYGAQKGLLSSSVIKRRLNEYRWPASTLRFS